MLPPKCVHMQTRYAVPRILNGQTVGRLHDGLFGVAPGQTMVLYQGTRVLGQSTIARAYSLAREDLDDLRENAAV